MTKYGIRKIPKIFNAQTRFLIQSIIKHVYTQKKIIEHIEFNIFAT